MLSPLSVLWSALLPAFLPLLSVSLTLLAALLAVALLISSSLAVTSLLLSLSSLFLPVSSFFLPLSFLTLLPLLFALSWAAVALHPRFVSATATRLVVLIMCHRLTPIVGSPSDSFIVLARVATLKSGR